MKKMGRIQSMSLKYKILTVILTISGAFSGWDRQSEFCVKFL